MPHKLSMNVIVRLSVSVVPEYFNLYSTSKPCALLFSGSCLMIASGIWVISLFFPFSPFNHEIKSTTELSNWDLISKSIDFHRCNKWIYQCHRHIDARSRESTWRAWLNWQWKIIFEAQIKKSTATAQIGDDSGQTTTSHRHSSSHLSIVCSAWSLLGTLTRENYFNKAISERFIVHKYVNGKVFFLSSALGFHVQNLPPLLLGKTFESKRKTSSFSRSFARSLSLQFSFPYCLSAPIQRVRE